MYFENYRIHTPVLAVLEAENGVHTAYTVPVGTILNVERNGFSKLVEVDWDGKRALMFGIDVGACGEKIDHESVRKDQTPPASSPSHPQGISGTSRARSKGSP